MSSDFNRFRNKFDNVETTKEQNIHKQSEYMMDGAADDSSSMLNGKIGSLVRWVSDSLGGRSASCRKKLLKNLSQSIMFGHCSESTKMALLNSMVLETFKKGQVSFFLMPAFIFLTFVLQDSVLSRGTSDERVYYSRW